MSRIALLTCAIASLLTVSCGAMSTTSGAIIVAGNPEVSDQQHGLTYQGMLNNTIESFLNIKFGKDTSGQGRFAPPQPYTYPTNTLVNATADGAACPQALTSPENPSSTIVTKISEDCLTLRIDRPENITADAKLPVMVYGGGWVLGQIYDSSYDPTGLLVNAAKSGFPVIYAAINYRVNIFGLAASEALAASDSLNVALLDQRFGLEWIKENIGLFGGDPDNITIFGESAGAIAIGSQLVAYGGTKPVPFKGLITESGATTSIIGATTNSSAVQTSQVAVLAICTSSDPTEQLSCLRAVPMETYVLKVDPLNDAPSKLLREGRFAKNIQILTGWNEDDGTYFEPSNITNDAELPIALHQRIFLDNQMTKESLAEMLALCPVSDFSPDPSENISAQFFRTAQISRDIQFTCPSILMVEAMAYHSTTKPSNYIFTLNENVLAPYYAKENESYLGITHGSDLPYLFDQTTTDTSVAPSQIELCDRISGSWAYYANTGGPVSGTNSTLHNWPQALEAGDKNGELPIRVIGGPPYGPASVSFAGTGGALDAEKLVLRCAFWNSEKVQGQLGV